MKQYDAGPVSEIVVADRVVGTTKLVSTMSEGVPAECIAFENALGHIAGARGIKLSAPSAQGEALLEVSCGLLALYGWLRLNDTSLTLSDVVGKVSADSTGHSMQELAIVARTFDKNLVPIRNRHVSALPSYGVFIALLRPPKSGHKGSDEHAHYVLCHASSDSISIFSPPSDVWSVKLDAFSAIWDGNALVARNSLSAPRLPSWYYLALAATVCAGALVIWYARRKRTKVAQ